jgi:protein-tyrosine phosphatase
VATSSSTSSEPATTTGPRSPGLLNLRDLGGLPTEDGHVLAPRRLLRSAEPVGLSADELDRLRQLGVRSRIDLRGDPRTRACTELDAAGLEVHHHPFRDLLAAEDLPSIDTPDDLGRHYLRSVESSLEALAGAVGAIATEASLGVLVHCAWGKDRAGVVVASVLELLGVDRGRVVADYARTQSAVDALLDRVLARLPVDVAARADRGRLVLQAPAATMRTFLGEVDQRYGGVTGLLEAGGGDPDALRGGLQDRLLA